MSRGVPEFLGTSRILTFTDLFLLLEHLLCDWKICAKLLWKLSSVKLPALLFTAQIFVPRGGESFFFSMFFLHRCRQEKCQTEPMLPTSA